MSNDRMTRKAGTATHAGVVLAIAGTLAVGGCDAHPDPVSPGVGEPEGIAAPASSTPGPLMSAAPLSTPEPFTFRAPLDPYRINQPPRYMAHSRARTDIVVQRLVFSPGAGGWHTHPGPSFIVVLQGQIKLEQFAQPGGCTETPVFGPGDAYSEIGNEVHRAVVLGSEPAVLLVTRFNIPIGAPITDPADDPGC